MSAVIERRNFDGIKVRIRRRGKGRAGRFDAVNGLPWLLETKEPGDTWDLFRAHNTTTSAKWDRYSVWGGPRPGRND